MTDRKADLISMIKAHLTEIQNQTFDVRYCDKAKILESTIKSWRCIKELEQEIKELEKIRNDR